MAQLTLDLMIARSEVCQVSAGEIQVSRGKAQQVPNRNTGDRRDLFLILVNAHLVIFLLVPETP